MILLVTSSFHPFRIRRCLIFELICESIKIYAFRNPDSTCWTAYQCFILPQWKLPNVQLLPLTMSSLKNKCFQNNMCAETTLAIRLVLVILCEPVNVETESRNFSDLEVQRFY